MNERIKIPSQIKSGIISWSKSQIANPSPNVLFQNQLKLVCSFQRYTMFSSPSVSLLSVSMVTKGWLTSRTSAWGSPTPVPSADQDSWRLLSWPTSVKTDRMLLVITSSIVTWSKLNHTCQAIVSDLSYKIVFLFIVNSKNIPIQNERLRANMLKIRWRVVDLLNEQK